MSPQTMMSQQDVMSPSHLCSERVLSLTTKLCFLFLTWSLDLSMTCPRGFQRWDLVLIPIIWFMLLFICANKKNKSVFSRRKLTSLTSLSTRVENCYQNIELALEHVKYQTSNISNKHGNKKPLRRNSSLQYTSKNKDTIPKTKP